jgi:hypothetical protein
MSPKLKPSDVAVPCRTRSHQGPDEEFYSFVAAKSIAVEFAAAALLRSQWGDEVHTTVVSNALTAPPMVANALKR